MSLEKLGILVSILGAVGAGLVWALNHLDKRAGKREAAKLKAQQIDQKLENLQDRYDELSDDHEKLKEELDEVRRDFAQFVQQLLFKSK